MTVCRKESDELSRPGWVAYVEVQDELCRTFRLTSRNTYVNILLSHKSFRGPVADPSFTDRVRTRLTLFRNPPGNPTNFMNLDEDARDTLDGLKKSLKAKALSQKEVSPETDEQICLNDHQVKDTLLPLLSCRDLSVRRQACSLLLSLLSTSPASTYSSLSPDILEALAILLSKLPGSLQLVAESSLTTSVLRIVDLLVGRAIISKPLLTKLAIFTATYSYSVAPVTSIRSKTISAPILSAQNRSNRKNRASTSASESETEYEQAYSRNSRKEIQLRMAALDCLTTIAQRDPIVLHPIWTTYLFSDPYAPLSPALLNIVENEVNIDLRLKAAGAVLAILGKAKQFMSIADQKCVPLPLVAELSVLIYLPELVLQQPLSRSLHAWQAC